MPPVGIGPAIPASEGPQTDASDRTVTGTGIYKYMPENIVCLGIIIIIIIIIILNVM
jgi:hypothetical protein